MTGTVFQVRCSVVEKEGWLEAAALSSLSLSSWVRVVLNDAVRGGGVSVVASPEKGRRRVRVRVSAPESPPEFASGRCSAFVPWGTRCKLCGKVHS